MRSGIKPRKTPKQQRSQRTREEILEATAHLLNDRPLDEVSTNHIAQKTGISIGTLYKYYPNKDSILADLSLRYMQEDAELFENLFEKYKGRSLKDLIEEAAETLVQIHRKNARVRGVVYQNFERLGLMTEAQSARRRIQTKGTELFSGLDSALMWVTLTAISSTVFAMSQLSPQHRNWEFARNLCRQALGLLMASRA